MNQGSHGSVNESAAHGQPASKTEEQNVPAKAGPNAVKTFTGGDQGFIPLVLDSTEQVSRLPAHLSPSTRAQRWRSPSSGHTPLSPTRTSQATSTSSSRSTPTDPCPSTSTT